MQQNPGKNKRTEYSVKCIGMLWGEIEYNSLHGALEKSFQQLTSKKLLRIADIQGFEDKENKSN